MTYLLALVVKLTVLVGFSPLHTTARVSLDPNFRDGTVCLIHDSDEGSAGRDCWTVDDTTRQRTWIKSLVLYGVGHYVVWVTQEGRDTQGRAVKTRTPEWHVDVL